MIPRRRLGTGGSKGDTGSQVVLDREPSDLRFHAGSGRALRPRESAMSADPRIAGKWRCTARRGRFGVLSMRAAPIEVGEGTNVQTTPGYAGEGGIRPGDAQGRHNASSRLRYRRPRHDRHGPVIAAGNVGKRRCVRPAP